MPADTSNPLQTAMASGDFPTARRLLIRMLKKTPRDPVLHYNLATVSFATSDFGAAERHLLETLRLEPKAVAAHILLGDVHLRRGSIQAALGQYLAADRVAPGAPNVLHNIANCYAQTGAHGKAIDFLVRALVADPSSARTTALAKLMAAAGRQADARALFDHHAARADTAPYLLASFGQLFIQLEQRENALAAYDAYAARRPLDIVHNTTPPAAWVLENRFSAENPSARYGQLIRQYELLHEQAQAQGGQQMFAGIVGFAIVAPYVRRFCTRLGAKTLLDYGGGRGAQYRLGEITIGTERFSSSRVYLGIEEAVCFDPGFKQDLPTETFDVVICVDALEHCDRQDLPWIITRLFQKARRGVFANIAAYPASKILPNGENAHCTIEEPAWWMELFQAAAAQYPDIQYEVIVSKDLRQNDRAAFGRGHSPGL